MRARRVLITGGAGFIGSRLALELSRKLEPSSLRICDDLSFGYLENLELGGERAGVFERCDIRDPELGRLMEGVDTVFHFAGIAQLPVCQGDPARAYSVHVSGTANVLECARRAGVRRVIFSSTSAVYENSSGASHSETDELSPDLVYSHSKLAAEGVCASFARNYAMDVIICRFFNVYGAHQDFARKAPPFTAYLARELLSGRQPVLYNSSSARRDYVHVRDVVTLLQRMMESPAKYAAEVYNVGTGNGSSVPELVGLMKDLTGSGLEPVFQDPERIWERFPELFSGPFPLSKARIVSEVRKEAISNPAKVQGEFGWKPEIDIRSGLRELVADEKARIRR